MVDDELEEIETKTKSKMSMWATECSQECIPKPLAVQFEHLMTENESKTKNERQLNIQFLAQSCLRLHTDLFSAGKQLEQFKSIGQVTQLVVSCQLKQLNQTSDDTIPPPMDDKVLKQCHHPWTQLDFDQDTMSREDLTTLTTTMRETESVNDYIERLEELSMLGPFYMPLQPTLRRPMSEVLGTLGEIEESEEYQDGKDLQRDQICINGELIQGKEGGYDYIVGKVVNELHRIASNVSERFVVENHETFLALAKRILHVANRTQSGGASYEMLDHVLRHPSYSILRPNSKDATPLDVTIDLGPYMFEKGWAWGFRVSVEAHTSYAICDATDPMTEWVNVTGTYLTKVAISCRMSPYTGPKTDRAARSDDGVLQVTVMKSTSNKAN